MYQNILVNQEEGIQIITINREEKLNALNIGLINEIKAAIDDLYKDTALKGCVITGMGTRAFAAGADISEFVDFDPERMKKMSQNGHEVFNMIENCPKPVIAAVNGFALGGGCELAMACHIRLAAQGSKFGQPEVNLGIIPGYGGTQRMSQLVGKGRAFELLMTGNIIKEDEAHRIGLVNKITTEEALLDEAKAILKIIAGKAPIAIANVIRSVNAAFDNSVDGMKEEIDAFAICGDSSDFKEGASAFLEKRKPQFTGN